MPVAAGGVPIPEVLVVDDICTSCGERNTPGAEFCFACGGFLGWEGDPDSVEVPDSTTPIEPVPTRPPAGHGAAASPGPQPTATSPAPAVLLGQPPGTACPRCEAANDPTLRFCRKCGTALTADVATQRPLPEPPQLPWWHRLLPGGDPARRAARLAYRRATPLRYRVGRVVATFGTIGAVAGVVVFTGQDPVGWVRAKVTDIRGELVEVADVQATTDPPPSAVPDEFAAANLVDGSTATGWTIDWTAPAAPIPVCGSEPPGGGAILLRLPEPVTVHEIDVFGGLTETDSDRLLQWRPETLELRYLEGGCERVSLADDADRQALPLTALAPTAQIKVYVVSSFTPDPGGADLMTIREIDLFSRP